MIYIIIFPAPNLAYTYCALADWHSYSYSSQLFPLKAIFYLTYTYLSWKIFHPCYGTNSIKITVFIQDAQEFLNFLINHINEIILGEQQGSKKAGDPDPDPQNNPTWINDIFQVRRVLSVNIKEFYLCF